MEHVALDGFWLLGGLAVAYLLGVFTAQAVKDKINGVPSDLRSVLSATESSALAELSKARTAVLNDVGGLFTKAAAATSAAKVSVTAPAAAPATPAPAQSQAA